MSEIIDKEYRSTERRGIMEEKKSSILKPSQTHARSLGDEQSSIIGWTNS